MNCPDYFSPYIGYLRDNHNRNTRASIKNNIAMPTFKSMSGRRTFHVGAINLRNNTAGPITKLLIIFKAIFIAWENSQRFTRSLLEPSQNDVWVTSAEIPYWWRVSAQILVVPLIGWNFLSTNQKHYQDLGSERHQYGISVLVTQTSFCKGSSGDLVKRRVFSQATFFNL